MRISDWSSDVCSSDLFSRCTSVSAAGAVILASEIQRCMEILRRRKADRLTGNYPTDPNVAAFLSGIGFFRLLAIRPPRGARGIGACGRLIKLASNNKISEQADRKSVV